jgi:predicted nuclease of predicted toxin-antitoxin system
VNAGTSVRFKVDEDLPLEVAKLFVAAGWDAASVFAQQMHGWSDDRLWAAVAGEGRSLVTADVGFADARRLVGQDRVGIVLLRAHPESRQAYIQLASTFLGSFPLERVPGCIVTVSADAIRVHDTRK